MLNFPAIYWKGKFEANSWVSRTITGYRNAIAYGNSLFVSVGGIAGCVTSPDGKTWTDRSMGAGGHYAITYGNALFVAVGGSNKVHVSANGSTWFEYAGVLDLLPTGVAWNGSVFCMVGTNVGSSNTAATGTANAQTWTLRATGSSTTQLTAIAWAGSLFVAVGAGGLIQTSPDGISWTVRTAPATAPLRAVTWTGSLIVVVGDSGTVLTSTDGITWTLRTAASGNHWTGVAWTGEILIAVAGSGSGAGNRVMTSVDGVSWFSKVSAADLDWRAVCWGADTAVAVGYATGTNGCMTSES